MSRVYLACDRNTQQKVVLKFLNDDLMGNIAVFERYKREAEIGNRLNHPYVQHMLNTTEERSDQYLVMEYIHGMTLEQRIQQDKPLELPEILRIGMQLAAGLAAGMGFPSVKRRLASSSRASELAWVWWLGRRRRRIRRGSRGQCALSKNALGSVDDCRARCNCQLLVLVRSSTRQQTHSRPLFDLRAGQ